jgi:hypothetical protein
MRDTQDRSRKVFSVEEANRTLPLVRVIVADLVQLTTEVTERRQRLNHLLAGRERDAEDVYSEELAEVERGLQRDMQRLREYIEELRQLGVEPKGGEGLVDFPAELDGRPVYLCWKLGEAEVLYWHEIDAGFAGRQPLAVDSLSAGETDEANSLG